MEETGVTASTVHHGIEGGDAVVGVSGGQVVVHLVVLRHVLAFGGRLGGGMTLLAGLDGGNVSAAVVLLLTQIGGRRRGSIGLVAGGSISNGLLSGGVAYLACAGRERGTSLSSSNTGSLDLLGVEGGEHVGMGEVVGRREAAVVVRQLLAGVPDVLALGADLLLGNLLERLRFGLGVLYLLLVGVVRVKLLGLDEGLESLVILHFVVLELGGGGSRDIGLLGRLGRQGAVVSGRDRARVWSAAGWLLFGARFGRSLARLLLRGGAGLVIVGATLSGPDSGGHGSGGLEA